MKTSVIIMWLALANVTFSAVVRFTNVNDMALGIAVNDIGVVAGDRLKADMIISNASAFQLNYPLVTARGARDTLIGDFVVTDEFGNALRKTVPTMEWDMQGSTRQLRFPPGHAEQFGGDVVYGYSLTNPGTYFVKAIAVVPTTNPPAAGNLNAETMVIETPTVEITITPRPQSSPPPEPLYRSIRAGQDLAAVHQVIAANLAAFPPLRVTHPKLDLTPPVPRKARSALPQGVHDQLATGAAATGGVSANNEATASTSRNVFFAVIALLLCGGLAAYLWWSQRKHGNP